MNEERITYEEFMIMFKNAPRIAYTLYDKAEDEIERLKEELKYTIPIVEHNKTITKHLKEIEKLHSIIKEVREYINKIPTQPVIRVFKKELLEILDKGDK